RRIRDVVDLRLERQREHPQEDEDRRRDDHENGQPEAHFAQPALAPGACAGRFSGVCRPHALSSTRLGITKGYCRARAIARRRALRALASPAALMRYVHFVFSRTCKSSSASASTITKN